MIQMLQTKSSLVILTALVGNACSESSWFMTRTSCIQNTSSCTSVSTSVTLTPISHHCSSIVFLWKSHCIGATTPNLSRTASKSNIADCQAASSFFQGLVDETLARPSHRVSLLSRVENSELWKRYTDFR